MASNAPDDLPEGWEMYISSGSDVVLYINTLAKKQRPKPNCPGGWTLAARSPSARVLPSHSPDGINAVTPSSSTSTVSDSASHAAMHRVTTSRVHSNNSLPEEIRCSHILIKHWESRPSSWRSESMKRTKAEAVAMVKNFREQIMNKENRFEVIAKVFSDCSSAKRNGDLGRFKRGQMHKSFEMVAFKLKVGEISKPIESKSGIHLILRTL